MEVVGACYRIIWRSRATGSLKFWALENPTGLLRQFLGVPHFTFQPWWFGDRHTKRTDIWGYFSIPRRDRNAAPPTRGLSEGWDERLVAGSHHLDGLSRSDRRSITPPGFAQAFFKTNP